MGENDFFMGFAGHAHTMNELELDPQKELELRTRNSPEEAQKLTGIILDKLEARALIVRERSCVGGDSAKNPPWQPFNT